MSQNLGTLQETAGHSHVFTVNVCSQDPFNNGGLDRCLVCNTLATLANIATKLASAFLYSLLLCVSCSLDYYYYKTDKELMQKCCSAAVVGQTLSHQNSVMKIHPLGGEALLTQFSCIVHVLLWLCAYKNKKHLSL